MDKLERSPRFKLAGSLALCGLLIVSPLLAVLRSPEKVLFSASAVSDANVSSSNCTADRPDERPDERPALLEADEFEADEQGGSPRVRRASLKIWSCCAL